MESNRFFISFGAFFGMTSVVLGAIGSHMLKNVLSPAHFSAYTTAVSFQFFHALFLLFIGLYVGGSKYKTLKSVFVSGYLAVGGIILFSGSIYLLVLTGVSFFGPFTPVGGLLLIGSWTTLLVQSLVKK